MRSFTDVDRFNVLALRRFAAALALALAAFATLATAFTLAFALAFATLATAFTFAFPFAFATLAAAFTLAFTLAFATVATGFTRAVIRLGFARAGFALVGETRFLLVGKGDKTKA